MLAAVAVRMRAILVVVILGAASLSLADERPRLRGAETSIAGCLLQVTARSSQVQSLIGWMLPPVVRLSESTTSDTRSCTWADATGRPPTPLTRKRRKLRSTATMPLSTLSSVLAPRFVAGWADEAKTSASIVPAGEGAPHAQLASTVSTGLPFFASRER